jgi:hypothetical protein
MLTLTNAVDAIDPAVASTAGGFGWWYADLVDAAGNGVVVIAGEGLPFLPGLAAAARAGAPLRPGDCPAVNVAVYEAGRCSFYALQELPALPSTALSSSTSLELTGCSWQLDRTTLTIDLDVHTPVGHLRGQVRLDGPARADVPLTTLGAAWPSLREVLHRWAPQLGPCRGRATLNIDGRDVVIEGSGYHDRNSALRPLHALGIRWWTWARAVVEVEGRSELRIVYALWPDGSRDTDAPAAFGVVVDDDGNTRCVDITLQLSLSRTWLGMRRVRRLVATTAEGPFLVGEDAGVVDDGPFYLRSLWRAGVRDAGAVNGFIEVVSPHDVDRDWQRPFVRMKVSPASTSSQSSSSRASLWHPLLAGTRAGRCARQWRWLMGDRR